MKNQIDFEYIRKTLALSYSQTLAARMLKLKDEEINDILWFPYAFEEFNQKEIENRLEMLTPENSYTIFLSKLNNQIADLQREKWY